MGCYSLTVEAGQGAAVVSQSAGMALGVVIGELMIQDCFHILKEVCVMRVGRYLRCVLYLPVDLLV